MVLRKLCELEHRCLKVITKNFERYFTAFKLPSTTAIRDHLEFLARLYTEILIERLKKIFFTRPKCLDFFINRHLRKLNLSGAYSYDPPNRWDVFSYDPSNLRGAYSYNYDPSFPPTLLDKLRTYGEGILSLEAESDGFKETFYESLVSALPKVEYVKITKFAAADIRVFIRILQCLGRNCPRLQVLEFDDYLKGAPANEFHDSISFVIKHCPRLEVVEFYDSVGALYNLHKSDLDLVKGKADVKQFPKYVLKKLYSARSNYPIGDALEICSVFCPQVSSLYIEKTECDQDFEKISGFTFLENVTLLGVDTVSPNSLNQFLMLRGSTLISLELSHVSCLSISTLIESCPKLQELKLWNVVGHSCCSSNERCKTSLWDLRVLIVSNCNFAEEGVAEALKSILSGATKLVNLTIYSSSGLTDTFFNSLGLHKLPALNLRCSDIEMDPLRKLLLCGSLEYLDIYKCPNITRRQDLIKDIPSDRIAHTLIFIR